MKKIAILFTALIFTVISCKDDPCEGIINGTDVDGTCVCLDGYEGDTCETEVRTKFYGTWAGMLSGCELTTPLGPYPLDIPVEITISENVENLLTVDVTFGENETTSMIIDGDFVLAPVTENIEVPVAGSLEVTYSGVGMVVSDTEMSMELAIDVTSSLFSDSVVCPLTLMKQ